MTKIMPIEQIAHELHIALDRPPDPGNIRWLRTLHTYAILQQASALNRIAHTLDLQLSSELGLAAGALHSLHVDQAPNLLNLLVEIRDALRALRVDVQIPTILIPPSG